MVRREKISISGFIWRHPSDKSDRKQNEDGKRFGYQAKIGMAFGAGSAEMIR